MIARDPFRLDGRRVLVTGATSDIGRAIAVCCANAGAETIATGRDRSRLERTIESLPPSTGHHACQADLDDDQDRGRLVDEAGQIDGVVHVASIADPMLARSLTETYIRKRFTTNVFAPMLLTARLLAKGAIRDGGSIVFISSMSAHTGTRGMSVYAGTKAAQVAAMRCLALEVAPKRIRANAISPAIVRTSVYATLGDHWLEEQAKRYPLGIGEPRDGAYAALFLLSDASRWITGETMMLDGACPWI